MWRAEGDSVWEIKSGPSPGVRFSLLLQTRLEAPALGPCIWPALQLVPCSPQLSGRGLLPLLPQTARDGSQPRRSWCSHGLLPRLEAVWRPLSQGCRATPSCHCRPPDGVNRATRAPASSLPASHANPMPALPGPCGWRCRVGVIPGHGHLRVRMGRPRGQLEPIKGQTKSWQQQGGLVAEEKGVSAGCGQPGFFNPSHSCRQGVP